MTIQEIPTDPREESRAVRDAERALIGELVMCPDVLREVAAVVTPDDFGNIRLGAVFNLVAGLLSAGGTVDGQILAAEVAQRRKSDASSWPDVRDLAGMVGSGSGLPGAAVGYAKVIAEASLRRSVAIAARRALQLAECGEVSTLIQDAMGEFQAARERHATGTGVDARTLREILDTVDPGYDWVIPDLLERGDRLIVTGFEGLGKSTWLRQLVILAAAGIHPMRLRPIPPVTALVIDAENSERQWRRKSAQMAAQAARNGQRDPRDHVHLSCNGRLDLTRSRDLEAIHRSLDELDPDIVMIGPLYKLVPQALNNDTDAAPLIVALDSLRDRGVTLLMEAHQSNEGSNTRDLRPRGSRALVGWPEFGFGLARNTDNPNMVDVLRWRGDRDERDWPDQMLRGGPFPWTDERVPDHIRQAHYMGREPEQRWSPADALRGAS